MEYLTDVLLIGRLLIDRYYVLKDFPIRGQEAVITDSFERVGGCTFNAAATIKNLGGDPLILSPICNDERGRLIQSTLQAKGFKDNLLFPMEGATEYCVALLDGAGERTFLTYSGSQFLLTDEILQSALQARPAYVHLSGYSLVEYENAGRIITLLEGLKAGGSKIFFDPSPLCKEIKREVLKKVIKLADIFCPNKKEMQAIGEYLHWKKDLTAQSNLKGGRMVVVKDGLHGATGFDERVITSVPAFPVATVDSSGAGDSFAGGLLYALLKESNLRSTVIMACACGALTAAMLGPQIDFTQEDINEFINLDRNSKNV
ncbi:MAG: carbohydrate kinase family protein [Leptolinea sp.]